MTASVLANLALALGFASVWPLSAQIVDVAPLLKGIEQHYNNSQTLELNFVETYTARGRKRTERGTLTLRKPGKMRWVYSDGKLFVSDGSIIFSYDPEQKRAERMRFKDTEDMRAPLAFLLGKLDFQRDFREFRASREGGDASIIATPKSGRLPYAEVAFLAGSDFTIRRLTIKNEDNSTLEFQLDGEKRNPAVADAQFRFTPPPGVEVVDATR